MANTNDPHGFRVIGARGNYMPQSKTYKCVDGTALYLGSPVKLAGGADANGIATIALAADSDKPVGVVVGFDQVRGIADANFNLARKHRPASVDMYVFVVDDPEVLLEAQADDALVAADIGLNCGFVAETGETVYGKSTVVVDSSDKAVTSTLPLRIEGLYQQRGNAFGANQKVIVSFNKHAYKTGYDTGATAEIGGLGV